MSETERRYAQIEKEALATTWACEKFANFIVGTHFQIETDHKPLVPLLGVKHLDGLPPRVLRFRLRLDRFSYDITHVPGKELYTADTLSRAPLSDQPSADSIALQDLAELCVIAAVSNLPASNPRLETYRKAQSRDPICQKILKYCHEGWPDKREIDPPVGAYWEAQGELTVGNGLLMHRQRIVVPKELQTDTLRKLHEGHQGIVRCRLRARISVWWPGQRYRTRQGTPHPYSSPGVPLAKGCSRPLPPQRSGIPGDSGLLLPLPGSPQTEINNNSEYSKHPEDSVRQAWYPRDPQERQRPSVQLPRIR